MFSEKSDESEETNEANKTQNDQNAQQSDGFGRCRRFIAPAFFFWKILTFFTLKIMDFNHKNKTFKVYFKGLLLCIENYL